MLGIKINLPVKIFNELWDQSYFLYGLVPASHFRPFLGRNGRIR